MRSTLRNWYFKLAQESGQAVIEYVLILTVAVGVILGGLYQLNDAFKQWADSYFGDYLACLLETGEMPALGGGSQMGECGQLYQDFSLAKGRPLVGSGVGAGGTGAGGGDENQTGEFGSGGSGDSGVYAGGAGSAAVVQTVPSADLGRGSSRFRVPRAAGAGSGSEEGGEKTNTGTAAITDLGSSQAGKAIRIPVREVGSLRGGRRVAEEKEEKEKTKVASATMAAEQRKGPERIKVDRRIAQNDQSVEIEEFTFGKFLRYLVIAAIIIAIVLFIGGQALQVSKSL